MSVLSSRMDPPVANSKQHLGARSPKGDSDRPNRDKRAGDPTDHKRPPTIVNSKTALNAAQTEAEAKTQDRGTSKRISLTPSAPKRGASSKTPGQVPQLMRPQHQDLTQATQDLWFTDIDFVNVYCEKACGVIPCFYNTCNANNSNFSNIASKTTQGVVNLSNRPLLDSELSLLSKGLTFVDTLSSPDLGIISEDINKFHLSIRRKLAITKCQTSSNTQVTDTPTAPFEHSKFKNPSRWNPPGPAILEHMALVNETEILNYTKLKSRPLRHNMTSAEFTAKQVLAKDNSIVIKKPIKALQLLSRIAQIILKKAFANYQTPNSIKKSRLT